MWSFPVSSAEYVPPAIAIMIAAKSIPGTAPVANGNEKRRPNKLRGTFDFAALGISREVSDEVSISMPPITTHAMHHAL